MTATTHTPKEEDDAAPRVYEDNDMPIAKSTKDALAKIAKEAVRLKPSAPVNPGFRNKSRR